MGEVHPSAPHSRKPVPTVLSRLLASFLFTSCLARAPDAQSSMIDMHDEARPPCGRAVEVPFEFVHSQVVLSARVDGRGPFHFLLDTGTDPSAVDLSFARELGLPLAGQAESAQGAGGRRLAVYGSWIPNLTIPGLRAGSVPAVASDLTGVLAGREVRGVLGYSFLMNRIVQVDYPGRMLRFYPDDSYLACLPSERLVLPMHFYAGDNSPGIDLTVNGRPASVILDTGSFGSLSLFPVGVRQAGLEADASRAHTASGEGYGGRFEVREGTTDHVVIGGFVRADAVPTRFRSEPYSNGETARLVGGSLGNGFLKDYVVTLDYRNRTVVFTR